MNKVLFLIGIILVLIGAAIMFEGSILGERTVPAAIVLVIVGICLIASSSPRKIRKS